MISRIKSFAKKYGIVRRVYYNYILSEHKNKSRLPWERVCRNSDLLELTASVTETRKRVLLATCTGDHQPMVDIETLLSVALSLRGAQVHALLCDRFLPACLMCEIGTCISVKKIAKNGPSQILCRRCFDHGLYAYHSAGIKTILFSDFITQQEITDVDKLVEQIPYESINSYKYQDLLIGEHAMAGALRFFAKGSLNEERYANPVLKRYLKASLLTVFVLQKMQQKYKFDSAVFHHGIYVPHGIIGEVFRKEGVPVINWNIGYRKKTFIFSHNDTYHHTMMAEPLSKWESITWNPKLEQRVLSYILNRSKGTRDWHVFLKEPSGDIDSLGINPSLPAIGLLTNVCWDAQLHYPANIFNNMLEWIFLTIDYFIKKPELQLIIRVHPAEITAELPSRQLVVKEIEKKYPILPHNIFVISPESKMNTYALMENCNAVIIYGTKTGVELTSFGIPVIVAGEAWIRNKGITIDPELQKDYFKVLDTLPFFERMNDEQKQRARKYAYHFFFRRMIPIEVVRPTDGFPSFALTVESMAELMPGKNPGLDVICEGILNRKDFIYEDEKFLSK